MSQNAANDSTRSPTAWWLLSVFLALNLLGALSVLILPVLDVNAARDDAYAWLLFGWLFASYMGVAIWLGKAVAAGASSSFRSALFTALLSVPVGLFVVLLRDNFKDSPYGLRGGAASLIIPFVVVSSLISWLSFSLVKRGADYLVAAIISSVIVVGIWAVLALFIGCMGNC
jgi:hypothetical protein